MSRSTEEVELKLEVVGADPKGTLDLIERFDRIGRWDLSNPERHRIHDLYWDTPGRALGKKRLTLRIRELDGTSLLTTKGQGRSERGLFRRSELELPATRENWAEIRSTLAARGVSIRAGTPRSDEPAAWLRSAGLIVTQDRATDRRVRYVIQDGERVAEMALDVTTYTFDDRWVDFHEVEIERLDDSVDVARAVGDALQEHVPGKLRPARMGKYSRGLRMQRRHREQFGATES